MNIRSGLFGNGSGAPRTHRAGHAVLRGPLDVNGQGRHGTGVWMRKTRIRIPPRAYRPPNDPLPRPGTNSGTPDKHSFFRVSVRSRSTPIACPALIREGARRVCRTPMTLGVATRSCPPTIDARVCRAPATPRRNDRPTSRACGRCPGGVSLQRIKLPRTSQSEPSFSSPETHFDKGPRFDWIRSGESSHGKTKKKCAMGF